MMTKQNADGSESGLRESDSAEMYRIGGAAGSAGSNVPSYPSGATLAFNVGASASSADAAGALLAWQNMLGYDIIITNATMNVTTTSANNGSASFGASSNSTGLSSTILSGKSMRTQGLQNNQTSVYLTATQFLTGSTAGGTASGVAMQAFFTFLPVKI